MPALPARTSPEPRPQLRNRAVIEFRGDSLFFHPSEAINLIELTADVPVVLGLDRDLIDDVSRKARLDETGVKRT